MKHLLKPVLLIAVVAGIVWALTSWPRLREAETGKTPEYPELRVRDYSSAESVVVKAAKAAVERLPGWTLVGSGSGPGGGEIRAVDAVQLIGTGMCLGAAILALVLFLRSPLSS